MADPTSNPTKHGRPYPHQVGGHGQLAMTTSGQLLKPLHEKEHKFYQYIHSDDLPLQLRWIRHVTPKFYGETDYPKLSFPRHYAPSLSSESATTPELARDTSADSSSHPPRNTLRAGSLPVISPTTATTSENANHLHNKQADNCTAPTLPPFVSISVPPWRSAHGEPLTSITISPWAAQIRLRSHSASSGNTKRRPRRSIALEDVNSQFIIPCVMDCKIGTRHYDDDATPEKRHRHIEKANRTTSAKCGMRYTGMQVFKREVCGGRVGILETTDKYHGRELKEHDLVPEATWFFHDGFDVRLDCVEMMLERLLELRRFIFNQHHFFFYSSSLLLVYEGALSDVAPLRVDVRMIDFAHTVLSNGHRDDGYVKGVSYLIHVLSQILSNEQSSRRTLPMRDVHSSSLDIASVDCNSVGSVSTINSAVCSEREEDAHNHNPVHEHAT